MVRGDGVDDLLGLAELLGQVRADDGVGAFDLVVHGLADVVQQPGAFGLLLVEAEFGRHDAAQEGDLHGVLEHVLGEAGAVVQAAEQVDDLGVDAVDADVEGGLLADLLQLGVHLALDLAHDLLDARRVDAAVVDEPLQGLLGDLPLERAEGGQDHGLRGVVDDQVDAGGRFQGADVAALAADDAALHVFGGQGHGGHGLFARIVARIPLQGQGKDFLGLLGGVFLGLHLDIADHLGRFVAGARFDLLEQVLARLLHGQAGNLLELALVLVRLLVEVFLHLGQVLFELDELLLQLDHLGLLVGDLLTLGVEALLLGVESLLLALELALAVLELALQLLLLVEYLVLRLEAGFLFQGFAFLARLFDDALGQPLGIGNFFVGDIFEKQDPGSETGNQSTADHGDFGKHGVTP